MRCIKWWRTSSVNFGLHVMSFERILCKEHKIKENSKSPNINWYSIIRIADDFWSHIFFSPTVSFCSSSSNGSCKTKISNFIAGLGSFWCWHFSEENIFRFYISMYKVPFMDAFEALHHFHDHSCGLFQWEGFSRKFGLISEKIALFTIFKNYDNKVRRWNLNKMYFKRSTIVWQYWGVRVSSWYRFIDQYIFVEKASFSPTF